MSRIRNLYDLHKHRQAVIEEDSKSLTVTYDLGSVLLGGAPQEIYETRSFDSPIFGKMVIHYQKNKLALEFHLEQPDSNLLYRIFLVVIYLLGDNITLFQTHKDFPLYPIPKSYTMGEYDFSFTNRKRLILKPKESIEKGLLLFKDPDSYFSRILVPLLKVNNLDLCDIRFFAEFVLLERLSKDEKANTTIVQKANTNGKDALAHVLYSCRQEIMGSNCFDDNEKAAFQKKLSFEAINSKGGSKDKMYLFIQGLGDGFDEYKQYIDAWHILRTEKGVAHGALLSNGISLNQDDMIIMDRLHELLCKLLFREFVHDPVRA